MRKCYIPWRWVAVGGASLGFVQAAFAASASNGDMTFLSQSRGVAVSARATDFSDLTDQRDAHQDAANFNSFSGQSNTSALVGAFSSGPSSRSNASQNSSLWENMIIDSGSVSADSSFHYNGDGLSTASSVFHVDFSAATAFDYTLAAKIDAIIDFTNTDNTTAVLELTDSQHNILIGPLPIGSLNDFSQSGQLPAGSYSLMMDVQASSDNEINNFIQYGMSFQTSPGSLTPDIATVPLPAAGPAVLMMLAGMLLVGAIRRRATHAQQD